MKLRQAVTVSAISLEHLHRLIAYDISSAVREFQARPGRRRAAPATSATPGARTRAKGASWEGAEQTFWAAWGGVDAPAAGWAAGSSAQEEPVAAHATRAPPPSSPPPPLNELIILLLTLLLFQVMVSHF